MVSADPGSEGRPLEAYLSECSNNVGARLRNYVEEGEGDRARMWVRDSDNWRRSANSHFLEPQMTPVKSFSASTEFINKIEGV